MKQNNVIFVCRNRTQSPAVGVPVYVKDEVILRTKFPRKHRGGVIIEDLTFVDITGVTHYWYKVRHANGDYMWNMRELNEVGGLDITTDSNIPNT